MFDPDLARGGLDANLLQLLVLVGDLTAHVDGHVAQVSDHGAHQLHVLLHFLLSVIICYPRNKKHKNQMYIVKGKVPHCKNYLLFKTCNKINFV